jgi:hypothetical protein
MGYAQNSLVASRKDVGSCALQYMHLDFPFPSFLYQLVVARQADTLRPGKVPAGATLGILSRWLPDRTRIVSSHLVRRGWRLDFVRPDRKQEHPIEGRTGGPS